MSETQTVHSFTGLKSNIRIVMLEIFITNNS